jgi:neutral ceramidase
MITCGISEIVITPPLNSSIPGQVHDRKAIGIRDDLYAKVMILKTDKAKLCIIALDTIGFFKQDVARVRDMILDKTGIPKESILVAATHTHTGGPIGDLYQSPRDDEYVTYIINRIEEAVDVALDREQPVRLGYGVGAVHNISFYRRFLMKDGSFATNAGINNPNIERPLGDIDPDVVVLRIDDLKGKPVGVVTNFACHLDTMSVDGNKEFSADYPGVLSTEIKNKLGQDVVSVFLNGACGNINHVDVTGKMAIAPGHYKRMGRILAEEVIKTRANIEYDNDITLDSINEDLTVQTRLPEESDIQWANEILESEELTIWDSLIASEYIKLRDRGITSKKIEIQALRIGNLFIGAFPGELFVEFGAYVKSNSLFKYNMISTLSNGCEGYITTKEAFHQGGYESKLTNYTNLAPGTGEMLAENILKLMRKIH